MTTDTGVLPDQDDAGEQPGGAGTGPDDAGGAPPPAPGRARRAARLLLTVLAFALVVLVLVAPHDPKALTTRWWARIPLEAPALAVLLLVLRGRARTWAVRAVGVLVGLLAALALLDVGFSLSLNRPFDLVLDWTLLVNAADYLRATGGPPAVVAGWAGAALLAVAVVWLGVAATRRVAGVLARQRVRAERVVAALAVGWLVTAVVGVDVSPGTPLASAAAAGHVVERAERVDRTLHDLDDYARELATDRFADVPGDRLLTGLRGKDVLLTFVESYGRVAVDDPQIGPGVAKVLDDAMARLAPQGYGARSGWLTSSTFGGASWLAHSTMLSGTDVDNPQRYRRLLASDRLTLPTLFGRAGWTTVGVMPSLDGEWPEENLYGYDRVHQKPAFGYAGPHFGWSPIPDQYVLAKARELELGKTGRAPVFAELALTSSHAPWAPLPEAVPWESLGDGSVYDPMPAQGLLQSEVWPDPTSVKREYGHSVEYSLQVLLSYVERYGDENTVLVVLGDHQPLPLVSGVGASRDVPVFVLAKDPAVLAAISGWGWDAGPRPSDTAPVWGMWQFRDRFVAAFSPQVTP